MPPVLVDINRDENSCEPFASAGAAAWALGPQSIQSWLVHALPRWSSSKILPEPLESALLLQAIDVLRSEWMLIDQLAYKLPFNWAVGFNPDHPVRLSITFTQYRDQPLHQDLQATFLNLLMASDEVRPVPRWQQLIVDGTLLRG